MGNINILPEAAKSNTFNERLPPKDTIYNLLDNVEAAVGQLRKDAFKLEEEKDILIATLDVLQDETLKFLDGNDREDILCYAERLYKRCNTIDVVVKTNRNQFQEDALNEVNSMINNLVMSLKKNPIKAKNKCESFIDACISNPRGFSDKKFESAVLGCTLDDQKRIRKRLEGLFNYINREFQ